MKVRPLSSALLIVYILLLGLGLGLGSVYWMLQQDPPFGSARLGPWKVWPRMGSAAADPYMRAITAKRGDVPLAAGEGLSLVATADSAGQPLDGACTYRVGSATPTARLWTLALYDKDGHPLTSELGRSGFTSSEIVRDAEDRFTIVLSPSLQAGNWLMLPRAGAFTAVLRLYDPAGATAAILSAGVFPAIERVGCAS